MRLIKVNFKLRRKRGVTKEKTKQNQKQTEKIPAKQSGRQIKKRI